jgi:hypothetical protein
MLCSSLGKPAFLCGQILRMRWMCQKDQHLFCRCCILTSWHAGSDSTNEDDNDEGDNDRKLMAGGQYLQVPWFCCGVGRSAHSTSQTVLCQCAMHVATFPGTAWLSGTQPKHSVACCVVTRVFTSACQAVDDTQNVLTCCAVLRCAALCCLCLCS